MKRAWTVAGLLFFLVYFIFCITYAYERICLTDTSYMFYKLIQTGWFNIEADRTPQVLTQLLMVPAIHLKIPMEALLMLYSLSFPLLFLAIYFIIVRYYKNPMLAMVIPFSLVLTIRMSFFHAGTETHQSLVFAVLFAAWLFSSNESSVYTFLRRALHFLIGALLIWLTQTSHPSGVFILGFAAGFYAIKEKSIRIPEVWFSFAMMIVLSILKVFTTEAGSYEGQFLSIIPQMPDLIPNFFSHYSVHFIQSRFLKLYLIGFVLFSLGLYIYSVRKEWLKLAYVLAGTTFFMAFSCLIYHAGDSDLMMERSFMPLGFFVALPMMTDWIHRIGISVNLRVFICFVVLFFNFKGIKEMSEYLTGRLDYMDYLREQMIAQGEQKLILTSNQTIAHWVFVPWTWGIESLIYTTGKYGQECAFTCVQLDENYLSSIDISNPSLYIPVTITPPDDITRLNETYFKLPYKPYYFPSDSIKFQDFQN